MPRLALQLGAPLPDIHAIVDIVDATPTFILRATGDLVSVNATLKASYGEIELEVPPNELPPPLAIIPGDSPRPRCIRRDIGAERNAVERLLDLRLAVTDEQTAFHADGDAAIAFWTEGIGTLPDDWDRFIPSNLVDVTVRDTPVAAKARVSSGVDWLSLDVEFSSEGSTVSEDELRRALAEGHRLVKLADGTYAPISSDKVSDVLTRMAEIFAQGRKKLPLSQAGRVQDLLKTLDAGSNVAPSAREFLDKLGDVRSIEPVPLPKKLKAELRPYQAQGFSWLVWLNKTNTGGVLADDMGLGKTVQAIALLLWEKERLAKAPDDSDEPAVEKKTKSVKAKRTKAAAKEASTPAVPVAKAKKGTKPAKVKKGAKAAAAESEDEAPKVEAEPTPLVPEKPPRKGPLALVIAPTSVVPNWCREIAKFAPSLKTLAWVGRRPREAAQRSREGRRGGDFVCAATTRRRDVEVARVRVRHSR